MESKSLAGDSLLSLLLGVAVPAALVQAAADAKPPDTPPREWLPPESDVAAQPLVLNAPDASGSAMTSAPVIAVPSPRPETSDLGDDWLTLTEDAPEPDAPWS